MTKPLQFCEEWRKMNGPRIRANGIPGPDHKRSDEETATMADISQYTDSTLSDNREQQGNWRSLADLARTLIERAAK